MDQEFQNHRISTTSSSSRDSTFSSYSLSSSWSVPSTSSGVESDFSEDTEEGQDSQPKPRRKPKKKSRSLLGMERFSMLFKSSPNICRRAQSMAYRSDSSKDFKRTRSPHKHSKYLSRQMRPLQASSAALDPLFPQRHVCVRRRPILSCSEPDVAEVPTLIKVVIFGGDKEAGRLARAYSDLQQKENKCPRLTKMCKLQFYFLPTRRRTTGSPGGGQTPPEGQTGSSAKATASAVRTCINIFINDHSSTAGAQLLKRVKISLTLI